MRYLIERGMDRDRERRLNINYRDRTRSGACCGAAGISRWGGQYRGGGGGGGGGVEADGGTREVCVTEAWIKVERSERCVSVSGACCRVYALSGACAECCQALRWGSLVCKRGARGVRCV